MNINFTNSISFQCSTVVHRWNITSCNVKSKHYRSHRNMEIDKFWLRVCRRVGSYSYLLWVSQINIPINIGSTFRCFSVDLTDHTEKLPLGRPATIRIIMNDWPRIGLKYCTGELSHHRFRQTPWADHSREYCYLRESLFPWRYITRMSLWWWECWTWMRQWCP